MSNFQDVKEWTVARLCKLACQPLDKLTRSVIRKVVRGRLLLGRCPHKLWLAVHHVVFYCDGGVTLPDNLIVVCTACHRNIHRGWLRVTGTAPDGLRWTDRYGNDLGGG